MQINDYNHHLYVHNKHTHINVLIYDIKVYKYLDNGYFSDLILRAKAICVC